MKTLFPIEPAFPEGFSYYPDFLTTQEEEKLYQAISGVELHDFNFQGFIAKRKVASFGYDYSFDKRTLTKGKEIPQIFSSLIDKVSTYINIPSNDFAELLVTQYPVGSVINWHRDAAPFDIIAGISILSDCIFRLRSHNKAKQSRSSIISFPVTRRSLYVMQGPARSDWQHSISPVKEIRYSITLRTLKKESTAQPI
jgi:alkylated DNA repair dioxygenase AlkB